MQVQRIAWEAIKQGYQEGEKQISSETILNVIMPDFRDLRTELRRKGFSEYAGEIHLTSASPERMEGVAPLSIKSDYYLIRARVDGAGHSKPVKVWVGSQPPPPSTPIITAIETAGHVRGS